MRSRRGFTLIELLIVMAIVAILAAIVYPLITDAIGDVESVTMAAMVRTVRDPRFRYQRNVSTECEQHSVEQPRGHKAKPGWQHHCKFVLEND